MTSWCSSGYAVACYDAGYIVSGSTWPDSSGNGRDLTFYAALQSSTWATVTSWTPTVTTVTQDTGSGVYFSGPSYGSSGQLGHYALLGSGSFPLLGAGNVFTVMAWIYPTSSAGPPVVWSINRYADSGTYNQAMQQLPCFSDSTGSSQGFGNGAGLPGNTGSCTTAAPTLNSWTHVAFVRSGLSGSYYINGVLSSTQLATINVTYGTANFTIGCDYRQIIYGTTNPRCFTGYIGSITFLKTALTSTNISQAYIGIGGSGASRYSAAAGHRRLMQAPTPAPTRRRRRLAQAPSLQSPSPQPLASTCLSVALLNSSGAAVAPAAAVGGSTAWDSIYGPLAAGNYTLAPTLLDCRGQPVSTTMRLTITLLPPVQAAPPPPPLAGAMWAAMEVLFPASAYDDLTADAIAAAIITTVTSAVVPAGGLAPVSALVNVSVLLDLALTWQVQGLRPTLSAGAGVTNLSAVACAVAAAPQIVSLLATGGATGPLSAQLLPDGSILRLELAGVIVRSAAAIAAAASALAQAWVAAGTLPSGASNAIPAPGGAVVRLQLAVETGVTLADASSASRGTLMLLDVATAAITAAQGSALVMALSLLGVTEPLSLNELCYTLPGAPPLCAWDLRSFLAALINALLSAAAPPGAVIGAPGTVGGAQLDLSAVGNLGSLINDPQFGPANATELTALRVQLLNATADLVKAGGSAIVAGDAIAATAALLNINVSLGKYQGVTLNATISQLPPAVVAAGLGVLAMLAPATVVSSGGECAALANVTTALLTAGSAPGGAPTALSRSSVDNAVAIFAAIAAASSFPLSPNTLQAVVTGLSLAATSPGASTPFAGAAPMAYGAAGAAATMLAATAAAQMSSSCTVAAAVGDAVGAAAQTVAANASGIGLSVSCHAPGSPADPLYAIGVSAVGGLASLAPIPSSLPLAGAAAVTVTLLALAFDAYGSAGTGGITVRLTFSDAATDTIIPLANLSEPLTFQVATPPSGPGSVLFWDTAVGSYSSFGVVTMANPVPAGAVLSWRPGFRANSTEDLPLAWTLTLPGCAEQLLNCSDAWERTLAVSLDPQQSIGDPVVACAEDTRGMRRVFVGHDCPLWLPGGGAGGCGWNISAQAFNGSGCVLDPITRVATLHTTDFYAGPAPRIELPPPAALAPPSLSELRRMALLLIILLALFVGMHVLAFALNVRDQVDMARALARIRSPELGCKCTQDGLYTWRLQQAPLENVVAGLCGSAVEFAALVGVPYSRLALAMPATLFGGQPLRHSTGRLGGISGSALREHHSLLMVAATCGLRAADHGDEDAEMGSAGGSSPLLAVNVVTPTAKPCTRNVLAWLLAKLRASEESLCAICYESLEHSGRALLVAPCSHRFHVDCIQASVDVGRSTRCPLCRSQVDVLRPLGWDAQVAAEVEGPYTSRGEALAAFAGVQQPYPIIAQNVEETSHGETRAFRLKEFAAIYSPKRHASYITTSANGDKAESWRSEPLDWAFNPLYLLSLSTRGSPRSDDADPLDLRQQSSNDLFTGPPALNIERSSMHELSSSESAYWDALSDFCSATSTSTFYWDAHGPSERGSPRISETLDDAGPLDLRPPSSNDLVSVPPPLDLELSGLLQLWSSESVDADFAYNALYLAGPSTRSRLEVQELSSNDLVSVPPPLDLELSGLLQLWSSESVDESNGQAGHEHEQLDWAYNPLYFVGPSARGSPRASETLDDVRPLEVCELNSNELVSEHGALELDCAGMYPLSSSKVVDDSDAPSEPPDLLQLSSTALVQAYLATWCLVGAEDIAKQQTRYIRALSDAGVDPDGSTFMRLFGIYKQLLMGPLFGQAMWIVKARLFRIVLLYQFDEGGGWEATSALAVALQASDVEPPSVAAGGLQRIRHLVQAVLSSLMLSAVNDGGVDATAGDNAATSFYDMRRRLGVKDAKDKHGDSAPNNKRQRQRQRRKIVMPMDDGDDFEGADSCSDAGEGGGVENEWLDDPLHFTSAALRRSMPMTLREAFGGDAYGASRAWATALAVAWLEQQDVGWLATDPLSDDHPRTLADSGAAALAVQLAARCGAEAAAKLAAELAAVARPQLARWAAAADARVTAARAAHTAAPFYALSQAQRVISALFNSLLVQCSTVAMCLSLYSVGMRRYMSAVALMSGLLAALLVNVGLFWSKGAVCCGDAREALGCGRDALAGALCRGFRGSCADLSDVFVPFAAAALALPPLPRPTHRACVAFPADDSARDTILAGFIGAVVALPVTAVVTVLFSLAIATDAGQPCAAVNFLTWPLRARCMLGRARWRLDLISPAAARRRSVLGRWWSTSLATDFIVAVLRATRLWPPKLPLGAPPDVTAGAALDTAELRMRRAGFAMIYVIWAVFTYLIVVYGRLLLRLLGPAADAQFAQSWLVALGAGQAAELRSFAVTAVEVLMVATILDVLWLLPNVRWLETQVDYASVQATAFAAPAAAARVTSWHRIWAYLKHFKAVHR